MGPQPKMYVLPENDGSEKMLFFLLVL